MITKLKYPKKVYTKEQVKFERNLFKRKNQWKITEDKLNYWLLYKA